MKILVTGGAGYIGSVTVERLRAKGEQVVVLDDLFRGHRSALDRDVPFYQGRIGDRTLIERIAKEHEIEACVHFAALAYVGESVAEPAKYFENNVEEGVALMGSLLKANIRRVVFSSTCATYGEPEQMPISETCPQWPKNPYGWSKFTMERLLESYDHAYGLKFVALRYFNASGATELRGEYHEPESHLVPNVLAAAAGAEPEVAVFGTRLSDAGWNLHSRLRARGRFGGRAYSGTRALAQGRHIGFYQSGNRARLFGAGSHRGRAASDGQENKHPA